MITSARTEDGHGSKQLQVFMLWLPFISYEHRGFQFYIGWRNGGNFGVKLRYSKTKDLILSHKIMLLQFLEVI